MPVSSANSVGSRTQSQTGSECRRRTASYKTVSRTSNVDQTLFGEPQHVKQRTAMLKEKWASTDDQNVHVTTSAWGDDMKEKCSPVHKKLQKPETVKVITKDMIRNLRVPRDDPSENTVILNSRDFMRLRARSKIISPEEEQRMLDNVKEEKEEMRKTCLERKEKMKRLDIERHRNEKLTDLEEEARLRAQYLLQKAMEKRQEDEDEIKNLNELILNAKIQAIRDAQILEKKQIKSEISEEERRLDEMMEIERKNRIVIQEEIEKLRKQQERVGAMSIVKQMEENEQNRLLELERKDQENALEMRRISQLMEEEYNKRMEKRQLQTVLRDELNRANEDMLQRKEEEKRLDLMNDLKVLEIQQERAAREAAHEEELQKIKIEKEKEIARLRAQQERARDEQAERDALRAKRAAEQQERDFRRKEIEAMKKKKAVAEDLREAREVQALDKERNAAIQAARDRNEFERILRAQKELIEKDKQEDDQRHKAVKVHSTEIKQQIRDKEYQKIMERRAFFEEGAQIKEEAKRRRQRMEEAKLKKMEELREAGIPEKYLAQVERKVQQSLHV